MDRVKKQRDLAEVMNILCFNADIPIIIQAMVGTSGLVLQFLPCTSLVKNKFLHSFSLSYRNSRLPRGPSRLSQSRVTRVFSSAGSLAGPPLPPLKHHQQLLLQLLCLPRKTSFFTS